MFYNKHKITTYAAIKNQPKKINIMLLKPIQTYLNWNLAEKRNLDVIKFYFYQTNKFN